MPGLFSRRHPPTPGRGRAPSGGATAQTVSCAKEEEGRKTLRLTHTQPNCGLLHRTGDDPAAGRHPPHPLRPLLKPGQSALPGPQRWRSQRPTMQPPGLPRWQRTASTISRGPPTRCSKCRRSSRPARR